MAEENHSIPGRLAARPRSRSRLLGAALLLLVAVTGGWVLWQDDAERPPVTAGAPAQPPGGLGPPTPDAAIPAPAVPPAPAPQVGMAPEPEVADEPAPPPSAEAEHAAGAFEPPLVSDNTNLSYARRAGLHRSANPLRLTATVALAVDEASGEVLHARNELAILPIASLTKLMTGIVLLESRVPLSERIRITRADVDTLRNSRSRLRVGTTLTRRDALQLALMSSENRAAHALARTFPGGEEAFVAAMNRKAAALGMEHSTFVDPTGLSNGNRATAVDVATLAAAAARYPLLRSFSTTERRRMVFGKRRLQYLNSNRLVRHTEWPILLQKTGYIVEAGQCVVMSVRTAGRVVTLVLMDAGSRKTRGGDMRKLRKEAAREVAALAPGR